jgi:beta-glucanase (GH16 family)
MRYSLQIVFLLALVIFLFKCSPTRKSSSSVAKAFKSEGFQLVWADEFDRNGPPDSANWKFEKGFVRNQEWQWYQEQNAWCENGLLIIEGRRETKPNPNYMAGSSDWRKQKQQIEYTSSSINTSGKHSWQYGRFLMRGRIDIRSGLWPAWWTLGINGRWPSNGEMDIMEYYSGQLLANIACGTAIPNKAEWYSNRFNVDSLGGEIWASKFHTWRMDWDANSISIYLDDQLLNKVELTKLVNKDGSNVNPFQQPHYMLLNLAIAGRNGGDPTLTTFPNRFEVDYVRVYQRTR